MQKNAVISETVGRVKLIRFPIFLPYRDRLTAAYSTRYGGVSGGSFESMNLGFERGDDPQNVCENYRLFAGAAGVAMADLVFGDQKHTANIHLVTAADRGKGLTKARDYQAVDGLVTDIPGLALVTLHADCVPVYFYDPVRGAIGLCHAGWRGTAGEIAKKMVERLAEAYRSRPADLLVAIGPAVCGKCYEVEAEVKKALEALTVDVDEHIGQDGKRGKYFPDLALINAKLVMSAGVTAGNIFIASSCTMEEPDTFFSHRYHHNERGSQAAVIQIIKR